MKRLKKSRLGDETEQPLTGSYFASRRDRSRLDRIASTICSVPNLLVPVVVVVELTRVVKLPSSSSSFAIRPNNVRTMSICPDHCPQVTRQLRFMDRGSAESCFSPNWISLRKKRLSSVSSGPLDRLTTSSNRIVAVVVVVVFLSPFPRRFALSVVSLCRVSILSECKKSSSRHAIANPSL